MGSAQVVLWTEGERGPRFPLDTASIAEAGGVLRLVACRDTRERIEAARDARVLVVSHAAVPEELFRRAPRLVGVVRTGIGLDTVDGEVMAQEGVTKVTLEELLRQSDIVSLHTPLTAETRGLIGEAAFRQMRPGAILINTSRGGVVDEPALIAALQSGRLAGAGLDVLAVEPPSPENPLLRMDTVVLTPHYASTTVEALEDLARKVNLQVVQLLRGEWPTYLANPEVRERPECRLVSREGDR